MSRNHNVRPGIFSIPVLVAALGYFVDIYDLLLFGIIRKTSLRSLGLSEEMVLTSGEFIISIQMVGLLIGGILWGVMGDKKGRLSVLFGSILLYSLANIANGMVQSVNQYALLRFVAGFGLTGAVIAYFISKEFDWRICYYIGGAMGLVLLVLRISVFESGMFTQVKEMNVSRGNFFMFFTSRERFLKYARSIL